MDPIEILKMILKRYGFDVSNIDNVYNLIPLVGNLIALYNLFQRLDNLNEDNEESSDTTESTIEEIQDALEQLVEFSDENHIVLPEKFIKILQKLRNRYQAHTTARNLNLKIHEIIRLIPSPIIPTDWQIIILLIDGATQIYFYLEFKSILKQAKLLADVGSNYLELADLQVKINSLGESADRAAKLLNQFYLNAKKDDEIELIEKIQKELKHARANEYPKVKEALDNLSVKINATLESTKSDQNTANKIKWASIAVSALATIGLIGLTVYSMKKSGGRSKFIKKTQMTLGVVVATSAIAATSTGFKNFQLNEFIDLILEQLDQLNEVEKQLAEIHSRIVQLEIKSKQFERYIRNGPDTQAQHGSTRRTSF